MSDFPAAHAESEQLVPIEVLADRITEGAGHLAAATGAWLALIEEYDRRRGWASWGVKSCAHWLAWRCGIGLTAAREHIRTARALADLPVTRAALAAGQLSYSKARALTRVATPESEASLVEIAVSCTGAQLEELARGMRRAGTRDEVNARHARRSVSWSWAEDGSLELKGRFSPEDGAVIVAALEAARDNLPDPTPGEAGADDNASAETFSGTPADEHGPAAYPKRVTTQRNADAMLVLAETLLASGPAPAPGGARHSVMIHTDLDALTDTVGEESAGRIENGPELHPETVRRLCCDSGAVIVAHHNTEGERSGRKRWATGRRGTWMDVGRRTRTIPAALRHALHLRDGGCRFPGCTETRFVDAHHVLWWSWGGPTALWNLVLLCRRHHRAVHEGGFGVRPDPRHGFVFTRPDRVVIPDNPATWRPDAARAGTGVAAEFEVPVDLSTTERLAAMHQVSITPHTATPAWNGDRLDLDYALAVLLGNRRAADEGPRGFEPTGAALN
ncbi:HNH endonuclease signature motif containing protein [Sporichthya brevicatena]|uniref:HNH endonuclease signature motif containing protein n=1 Tax=Sporichthya brevicatena TaxID=171442 RepID=A0ABN1GU48_9ACTN